MAALRQTALVVLGLGMAGTAGAQGDACKIDEGKPFQVSSAKMYIGKAASATGKEDERPKHLRNAVKVLTDSPEKINNQAGRNLLLSRVLLLWMNEQDALVVKRGHIGYTTNPEGSIDLLRALDTALTQVTTLMPSCVAQAEEIRRQPYSRLFNGAIEAFNAGQLDSAQKLTELALTLSPRSVNAYNMLGNIASRANREADAMTAMRKVVELSAGDTAFAKLRQTTMYNMAVLTANKAESAQGDERKRLATEAVAQFQGFLKEVPGDANGQQGLARSLQLSGNEAAVADIYKDMIANPAKFTDVQLFEAGVAASRAKQDSNAAILYEAGLAKNPYYRDALFNLANAYFGMKDHARMMPVVQRLVAVDPNSPQAWRLLAASYQLRSKDPKAAKKTDMDSLLALIAKSDKLPYALSVTQFAHAGAKHTVTGTIENRGTAAATYAMTVEFVDKDGKVVASKDVSVGPVAPKASGEFTAEVEGAGIVAFRTTPIK
jgi:tetratricopeptide (TPR) repeat protein